MDPATAHWWEKVDWTIVIQHIALAVVTIIVAITGGKRRNGS